MDQKRDTVEETLLAQPEARLAMTLRYMIVGCDFFEKDCGVQKSQLLWQLTTVDGLERRGR